MNLNMLNKSNLLVILLFLMGEICGSVKAASGGENEYRIEKQLLFEGYKRFYLINLPPNYYELNNLPLVIALHGGGGKSSQCEKDYKLTETADKNGYVIVYPDGVQSDGLLKVRTWNAGTCCDYAAEQNINDVGFISLIIDEMIKNYKVDSKRVYVTGMSNGAMMAYKLACEIPWKIAAIAAVSGTMLTGNACSPTLPVPILHIHSICDKKVPVTGGIGIRGYYFPPVDSVLKVWTILDLCNYNKPNIQEFENYTKYQWQNNNKEIFVEYYLTKDGGHAWPGGKKGNIFADKPSKAIKANKIIFEFFKNHHQN
ncbi:MAG: PHB depolymerase family esterase [bacterium]